MTVVSWALVSLFWLSSEVFAQKASPGTLGKQTPLGSQSSGGGSGANGGGGGHFGDILQDSDRDGLSDALEMVVGTSPVDRDSDLDQAWDSVELVHTGPTSLALRGDETPAFGQPDVALGAVAQDGNLHLTAFFCVPEEVLQPRFVVYALIGEELVDLTSLFLVELSADRYTYVRTSLGVSLLAISIRLPTALVGENESVAFGVAANVGTGAKAKGLRVYRSMAGVLCCAWNGESSFVQLSRPIEADPQFQSDDPWHDDLSCQRIYEVVKDGDGSSNVVTYECSDSHCEIFEGSSCVPAECRASQGTRISMISLSFLISLVL